MIIAIDWDDTFTSDFTMWQGIVKTFYNNGHTVYVVTSRGEELPIENNVEWIEGVIYCNFYAKKDVTEKLGIKVDIWIDDNPKYITESWYR